MQTAWWLGIKKNLSHSSFFHSRKRNFSIMRAFFCLLRQRENVISSTDYHHANIEFFSLFVVDEDDHLGLIMYADQRWPILVSNFLQLPAGREGAVGKLKRRNEKRVLQRDPVENLNEVILSLLHHIRI